MRVLLDENIPKRFGALLVGHEVWTVPQRGWASVKNGKLLALANEEYDVFISMDKGIPYQQNLSGKRISMVFLRAVSNRFSDLAPLAPFVIGLIDSIEPGSLHHLG
jgi:hypothetical protein